MLTWQYMRRTQILGGRGGRIAIQGTIPLSIREASESNEMLDAHVIYPSTIINTPGHPIHTSHPTTQRRKTSMPT